MFVLMAFICIQVALYRIGSREFPKLAPALTAK
jgi:hypothetical protein